MDSFGKYGVKRGAQPLVAQVVSDRGAGYPRQVHHIVAELRRNDDRHHQPDKVAVPGLYKLGGSVIVGPFHLLLGHEGD